MDTRGKIKVPTKLPINKPLIDLIHNQPAKGYNYTILKTASVDIPQSTLLRKGNELEANKIK